MQEQNNQLVNVQPISILQFILFKEKDPDFLFWSLFSLLSSFFTGILMCQANSQLHLKWNSYMPIENRTVAWIVLLQLSVRGLNCLPIDSGYYLGEDSSIYRPDPIFQLSSFQKRVFEPSHSVANPVFASCQTSLLWKMEQPFSFLIVFITDAFI